MKLKEQFEKETGFSAMALRQDYAGQTAYEDGVCDEYVEWLETKVKNLDMHNIGNRFSAADIEKAYGEGFRDGNHRDRDF